MKSWAAGEEIAGTRSVVATVVSTASAGATGAASVGPQTAMTGQPPGVPGIEP